MRVLAFDRPNFASVAIASAIVVILSLAVAIPLSGARPYGEQAILEQIDHEDSALCDKFGFAAKTPKFADCMLDLAGLRAESLGLTAILFVAVTMDRSGRSAPDHKGHKRRINWQGS